MKTIVFIPAKTSSKRVPLKNIRPFAGTSLLQVTIDFFKEFTDHEIVLSSDDEEIALTANSNRCFFHHRHYFCKDKTTNMEVLHDWICSSDIHDTRIILAQPSHPMRYQDDLVHINNLSSDHDYVSVVNEQSKYIQSLDIACPDHPLRLYKIDGSYYVINSDNIRYHRKLNFYPFLISYPDKRIDVDYLDQFNIAQYLYSSENS